MPLFESTNLVLGLLFSGSFMSLFYALAIAATNSNRWYRYSTGPYGYSVSACAVLFAVSLFTLLVGLFPKPRHLRAVRVAFGFVLLPLFAVAMGTVALLAQSNAQLKASICFQTAEDGDCEDGPDDSVWTVCGLPALTCAAFSALFWLGGRQDQLLDTKPQSSRARVATHIGWWALLSVLFSAMLMLWISAVPFLKFATPQQYTQMLDDFAADAHAFPLHPNTRAFERLSAVNCTFECDGCRAGAVPLTRQSVDETYTTPPGLTPFRLTTWSTAGVAVFPNVTDASAWFANNTLFGDVGVTCRLQWPPAPAPGNGSGGLTTVSSLLPLLTPTASNAEWVYPAADTQLSLPLEQLHGGASGADSGAVWRVNVTYLDGSVAVDASDAFPVLPDVHTGARNASVDFTTLSFAVTAAYTSHRDPRRQIVSIWAADYDAYVYEGPSSGARKGKGGVLVAFGAIAAAALVFAGHQLVYRKWQEAAQLGADVDYSDVPL